jgi:Ca-activated chloride channel family protein
VEALRAAADALRAGLAAEPRPSLDPAHREAIEAALAGGPAPAPVLRLPSRTGIGVLAASLVLVVGFAVAGATGVVEFGGRGGEGSPVAGARPVRDGAWPFHFEGAGEAHLRDVVSRESRLESGAPRPGGPPGGTVPPASRWDNDGFASGVGGGGGGAIFAFSADPNGAEASAPAGGMLLRSMVTNPTDPRVPADLRVRVHGSLPSRLAPLADVTNGGAFPEAPAPGSGAEVSMVADRPALRLQGSANSREDASSTEAYDAPVENAWIRPVGEAALSTFSIDVDTASYAIVRRCLLGQNRLPPKGAARLEEMVNYFRYDYPEPSGSDPVAVHVDAASCPWEPRHRLVRVALKAREVEEAARPPANLVLLLDVSGSMDQPNKLPLVRQSVSLLADRLTADDRLAMVVYAGASGLVLPATPGDRKEAIRKAIDDLRSGGSTNGGAGIALAYKVAEENFLPGGINRVVLATDGDFNVGVTNRSDLVDLVKEKAKSKVFLTALGFGMDNLKDSTLEALADRGNGNYGYVDNLAEARKVLVEEGMSTLHVVARDVKFQVEFNPTEVAAYRLVGYENRLLAAQDFADDAKDAGEVGAGHGVTAFYEVVPAGEPVPGAPVDALKYQRAGEGEGSPETLTVKLRWKAPEGEVSTAREFPFQDAGLAFDAAPPDFRFAAAVAEFALVLRGSGHVGSGNLASVREIAAGALGDDPGGYRAEFLTLVDRAAALSRPAAEAR